MFRAVVAKCSIGRWGLGAIRNGHWTPSDLRQVVCGFYSESHLPDEERCHLETYLDRRTWKFVYAWIAVLGVARASEKLWLEWNIWKQTLTRRVPKKLRNIDADVNSRTRGDYLFMESLQLAGRGDQAWEIFRESDLSLHVLKSWVLLDLIKDAYHAGDKAVELQMILSARYGDRIMDSGQPLRTMCKLDAVDSSGHAVISEKNAAAMYECLKTSLDPFATDGLVKGDTLAACREARMLHEADICETTDENKKHD
ncbi:hypothetical protein AMS68_001081 [Peltaster fructicola]|uniref:Uncharacterized protein n=1 Tax=Peltaster fructicola TaxID=286661 RepID=A0A6H0XLF8_9PEZI|nr:hypothetical protein AMS68_001081 [Peltaster fructicola]